MKKIVLTLTLIVSFLATAPAWATMADITYDYTASGNTYTFKLSVTNNFTENLDYFLITLDADATTTLYTNIAWVNGKGWTVGAFQDDTAYGGLPGAITADDAAIFGGSGGIDPGATLSGFTFKFDYTGSIDPENQNFSYLASFGTHLDQTNPDGYASSLDEEGYIRYVPGPNPNIIPEPSSFILLGLGLAGMAFRFGRRKN